MKYPHRGPPLGAELRHHHGISGGWRNVDFVAQGILPESDEDVGGNAGNAFEILLPILLLVRLLILRPLRIHFLGEEVRNPKLRGIKSKFRSE